ncbi:class I SAM-dependent methyltransferase [Paenibacillus sp. UNC451MF]|uniref:class I SAM-dependent methyltransferase n=1 Tax=Paenibacillus sp. UNC451MF TaxID=1449063 RepID=UPI000A7694F3|nr:class I SAM-dependent methyltransferase [Paenibacillus sp. UNC451MF]
MTKKRFAAHVLLFDCQKFILQMLENCGPHVEKIYVSYSEVPWRYNPQAREEMKNTADPDILKQSPYADKIELITGVWDWEHDQRNSCLAKAKEDGFDFLLVHDADEYYTSEDYRRMLQTIADHPDHDYYVTPWCTFWKSWEYILVNDQHSIVHGYPNIAMNCKRDIWFHNLRTPTPGSDAFFLDALCFHGSYVLNDEEVYRKINSWGHAKDFNTEAWFHDKWLSWTERCEDLHPTHPYIWKRAVKYNGVLPEVLQATTLLASNARQTSPPTRETKPRLNGRIPDWFQMVQHLEGWLSTMEQVALLHLPSMVDQLDGDIVEIGSYKGKSAACLAVGSQLLTLSKKQIYAIDPLVASCYDDFHRNVRTLGLQDEITSIRKWSTEAYEDCPSDIAALFIDGDHSYMGVKHDIDRYALRLMPGGVVAFHDYTHSPEVRRAVDELCQLDDFEYIADYDSLRMVRRKP